MFQNQILMSLSLIIEALKAYKRGQMWGSAVLYKYRIQEKQRLAIGILYICYKYLFKLYDRGNRGVALTW